MQITILSGDPTVYAMPKALEKMRVFCDLVKGEIAWLGHVSLMGYNCYLITDVFLCKQEVSAATCKIAPDGIIDAYERKMIAGEEVNDIKLWGHSHGCMMVTPSHQDEVQFEKLYKQSTDYFIRLITNKYRKFHISFIDVARGIMWEGLPLEVYAPYSVNETEIQVEIKQLVKPIPVKKIVKKYSAGTYNPSLGPTEEEEALYFNGSTIQDLLDEEEYYAQLGYTTPS